MTPDIREPAALDVVMIDGLPAIQITTPGNKYESVSVEIIKLSPKAAAALGRELIKLAGEGKDGIDKEQV